MPEIANNEELLSVGQLNNIAKELLEGHLANVSVVAEISNLSIPSSGHMYFTLKDDTGSCLLYTSPSPRDVEESRMPSSA